MKSEVSSLRWMYVGITIKGKKEAGSGLTTAQIAKVTSRSWLVLEVKAVPQTKEASQPDESLTNAP